jgi:hypothetical protein
MPKGVVRLAGDAERGAGARPAGSVRTGVVWGGGVRRRAGAFAVLGRVLAMRVG